MKTVHSYIPVLACVLALNAGPAANAQRMTLDEVIATARERSVRDFNLHNQEIS